jgi:hypothetical protein
LTQGAVPSPIPFKLDVIPSDYVARALSILLEADGLRGSIFHACSGPAHNLSLLDDLLPAVRAVYARRGVSLDPPRFVSVQEFERLLRDLSSSPDRGRSLFAKAMGYLLAYLDKVHLFDNTRAVTLFEAHGLTVPPPRDYLDRLLERQ